MNKNFAILIFVFIFAAAAGFFIYPKWIGDKYRQWRLGLDLIGGTHLVYEVDLASVSPTEKNSVLSGLRDIMEKRVNVFGVSEPNVVISEEGGRAYLIVELAGIKNPEEAIQQIGRTAFLSFWETVPKSGGKEGEVELKPTELTGRYLQSAQLTSDNLGRPQVLLNFSDEGTKLFAEITGRNVGKPLSIFIDNQPISSPVVREKISSGKPVITGMDATEAKNLVNLLNAGALPAPVNLVSQSTVGATLGAEFLKKTIWAGAIGTLLVMIFMSLYYRIFGLLSSLALLLYVIFTLTLFKLVGATMTLAGMAGFILSIGMAVDANILVFERAKEEVKKGLSRVSALEEGFRRAWPSIRDSNISTLITAFILYFFTTSFVQGFALTLGAGVLISMFSSITLSRALLRAFVKN